MQQLYSESEIYCQVLDLARQLNRDYQYKEPILLGVLTGSLMFLSDISRELVFNHKIDFIQVKSYQNNKQSKIKWIKIPSYQVHNQDIIIIEDIIDSGNSMFEIIDYLRLLQVKSISICTLCYKQKALDIVDIKYKGFQIQEEDFIFGYGLDNNEIQRNLKQIYKI